MKVLIFDTETTGLPKDYKGSIYDSDNWPYIVQLSYILFDCTQNKILRNVDDIIKVDNIPVSSIEIHKITQDMSNTQGISIKEALNRFNKVAKQATRLIAHNIQFDKKIIIVESIRNKVASVFVNKPSLYCTMKSTVDVCKIEKEWPDGTKYFKFPTLSELHYHLFSTYPKGVHNAQIDILICLRCYYYLEYKIDLYNKLSEFNFLNNL